MKPITIILAAILLLTSSGCVSYKLPAITAQEFHYRRTDPVGGTQIKAVNVRVDGEAVKADAASWNTTYPAVSLTVEVKGYERKLEPKEK